MKHLTGLSALTVSRQPEADTKAPLTCARVAMAGQRGALEWTSAEIDRGHYLDPLRYPLIAGLIAARGDALGGLHGFLADSLPDAWGMRLLARRLRRDGIGLETLPCVQGLSLVGHQGRGALLYDPCDKDVAHACGLDVMPSRLIASAIGPGWFATKRFDRTQGGGRIHMLSLCGALEAPSGITAIGYDTFLRATMAITRNMVDVEAVFLRMIFNILACNRDDHSRQHAYLQNSQGGWRLSPAFDLTFSHGHGGEHELDIDGESRKPARTHVLSLAKRYGVATQKIDVMVDAVRSALAGWKHLARQTGVSATSRTQIATTLAKIDRDFQN